MYVIILRVYVLLTSDTFFDALTLQSAALEVLLESMEKVDGIKGEIYRIDPKAIEKEKLYGDLDGTTLEWTDGVFTSLLRRILDNQKGESERRHWIVFDGDVDPECKFLAIVRGFLSLVIRVRIIIITIKCSDHFFF